MIDYKLNFQEEETPVEEETVGQLEGGEMGDESAEEETPEEPSTEEVPAEETGDDAEEEAGL